MRALITFGAFGVLIASSGCAMDPYLKDSATLGASGQFGAPAIHYVNGERKEYLLGSKIPRDSRENSEYTRTMSPRAYEQGLREQGGMDPRLPM
jgi:hypothetical protein